MTLFLQIGFIFLWFRIIILLDHRLVERLLLDERLFETIVVAAF